MALSRLVLLMILLTLAFSACSPKQAAVVASSTATSAVHPTTTVPLPTSTPIPSATATVAPLPSFTPLPPTATRLPAPTATSLPDTATPLAASPTVGPIPADASGLLPSLGCTNYNDPNVQITVPDGVAPYKVFCSGIYGTIGVGINALDANNKLDPKAVFAVPIKVCMKGRGTLMLMDMFGSFGTKQLKSTQEGSFTCAEVTGPGTVTLTQ